MSKYRWIITWDEINNGEYAGTQGPSEYDPDMLDHPSTFDLYDDDGIHYAGGVIFGEYTGFEPLDDFGTPDWGCTAIKLNGEWL